MRTANLSADCKITFVWSPISCRTDSRAKQQYRQSVAEAAAEAVSILKQPAAAGD
jgi:hypothetical protein